MARQFLCGFALAIGLSFAIGCSGSSSAPVLSKEEQDKKQKEMIERQKAMMPGGGAVKPPDAPANPEKK